MWPNQQGNVSRRNEGKLERRLAAVIGIDIVGYSLLMGRDEDSTHRRVSRVMQRVERIISKVGGQTFSFSGDGLMAAFPNSRATLQCAVQIHALSHGRKTTLAGLPPIVFRIGINVGEIVVQDGQIAGDVVNIAARLEQICEAGCICITAAVFAQIVNRTELKFRSIGERKLKNIRLPVMIYQSQAVGDARAHVHEDGALPVDVPGGPALRPRVAVLPLRNLGGKAGDDYLAEGVVEDIIVSLAGLQDLVVISRSSTIVLAARGADVGEVGRVLGVRYVVSGSIRQMNGRIRLLAELTEVETNVTLWAKTFDAELVDIFSLQDQIVRFIVSGIAPQIGEEELRRALRRRPESLTAYDLTLRALHRMENLNSEAWNEALAMLRKAREIDPGFAMPTTWSVWWHVRYVGQGWSLNAEEDTQTAIKLAKCAVALDPRDVLALTMQGHLHSFLLHDYDSALFFLSYFSWTEPCCHIDPVCLDLGLCRLRRGGGGVRRARFEPVAARSDDIPFLQCSGMGELFKR